MQISKGYIRLSIVFIPIVVFSYCIGDVLPLALIYGPLLYAIKFEISFKNFYLHLVLPILSLIVFFLKYYGFFNWNYGFDFSYDSFYYLLSSLSMIIYFIIVSIKKRNYNKKYSDLKKDFIYLIKPLYYLLFFFTFLLFLESVGFIIKLGFSIVFLLNIIIGIAFLIVLYYSIENTKAEKNAEIMNATTNYNLEEMIVYENDVKLYLEESKFFLNTNISLDLLSKNTGIPKHHLSRLFNLHMGKNFYQIISEYRIQYAEKRLKEDSNLTIESLAYECGFNSKSSFNKYFKENTSYTPSTYRLSFSNKS